MTKRRYIPLKEPLRPTDDVGSSPIGGRGRSAPSPSLAKIDFDASTGRFEVVQEGDRER